MRMGKVGIINCGLGNLTSVKNSFDVLNYDCDVIYDPTEILNYDRLVLPGVGAFGSLMHKLQSGGFINPILEHISQDKPFMGICLGMQVLFEESDEFGVRPGLGLMKGRVILLPKGNLPVPNVGWWDLNGNFSKFSNELSRNDTFYFVHSFHCKPEKDYENLTIKFNGIDVLAAVKFKNIVGYQFHPEKSQKSGQKLLHQFMSI